MSDIERNAGLVLTSLVNNREAGWGGEELHTATGLSPQDVNDAVQLLGELGAVQTEGWLGTAPYDFGMTEATARGVYILQQLQEAQKPREPERPLEASLPRVLNPVGSPYGFTDHDWEYVALRNDDPDTLYVVMGLQFKSAHYDTDMLVENVRNHFQNAVNAFNGHHTKDPVSLEFTKLSAGYGEHLFNEIARDILGSEIAVFETSDGNPNVMIELGVGLTWGKRILPLRAQSSPAPPSDISGQTWVKHRNSASEILDPDFASKLAKMVSRTVGRKRGRAT